MPPESRKLLQDMLDAAEAIARFVHGKTVADLSGDDMVRAAVYFKFVVIGEALTQLRKRDEVTVQRISEYPRIISFRNQITHGYERIDDEITWRIIEQKLPVLLRELKALLAE